MRRSWTPSIVPNGTDQTVYLVLDDFGRLGLTYRETDVERVDLESVISDLISGQYSNPVRVVAFNTAERWAEDASEDIAREIMRRLDLAGDELPSSLARLRRAAPRSGSSAHVEAGLSSDSARPAHHRNKRLCRYRGRSPRWPDQACSRATRGNLDVEYYCPDARCYQRKR